MLSVFVQVLGVFLQFSVSLTDAQRLCAGVRRRFTGVQRLLTVAALRNIRLFIESAAYRKSCVQLCMQHSAPSRLNVARRSRSSSAPAVRRRMAALPYSEYSGASLWRTDLKRATSSG